MKSVGEAMAIGRTFKESLQKCLRSLEIGRSSVRSEIFVATRATQFSSPAGAGLRSTSAHALESRALTLPTRRITMLR